MSEEILKLILEAIRVGGNEAFKIIAIIYGVQLLKLCIGMGTIVFVARAIIRAIRPEGETK